MVRPWSICEVTSGGESVESNGSLSLKKIKQGHAWYRLSEGERKKF